LYGCVCLTGLRRNDLLGSSLRLVGGLILKMQQLREEKIDEVQPINPRSSVACTAVIGVVAMSTCASPVYKEQNQESISVVAREHEFSSQDCSGLSLNSTPSAKPQGECREKTRSRTATIAKIAFLVTVIIIAIIIIKKLVFIATEVGPENFKRYAKNVVVLFDEIRKEYQKHLREEYQKNLRKEYQNQKSTR